MTCGRFDLGDPRSEPRASGPFVARGEALRHAQLQAIGDHRRETEGLAEAQLVENPPAHAIDLDLALEGGRVVHDFTAASLADSLAVFLRPSIAAIVQAAATGLR